MVSGHWHLIVPAKPTSNHLDKNSLGYQFEAQYRLQYNKPFLGGIFFSEHWLSRYAFTYTETSNGIGYDVDEKANTRRLEGGLTAGFYPEINWLLQPYLQGRLGVALFQTSSILTDDDSNELIERISESTTFAPAYGLDIGIHIVPNIWYLRGDIRIGITGNTSTRYWLLDEENKEPSGYPIDSFKEYSSAGRWIKVSAGISYLF
jgi:hypothetical protein